MYAYATPYANATQATTNTLLSQWGNAIVGNWKVTGPGSGTFTAAWNPTQTALSGTFSMTGYPNVRWTASIASSGQLVQNNINSDGTTAKVVISSLGNGEFSAAAACASAESMQIGSSNTTVPFSNSGNTMTHELSNVVSQGVSQPNMAIVFSRS
jgi:hypothetical protein